MFISNFFNFFDRLSKKLLCPNFFFFNDTATTEIYTLSLHDALPIYGDYFRTMGIPLVEGRYFTPEEDRKSTRLNSSHTVISYAVFCLKKKLKFSKYGNSRNDPGDEWKSICVFRSQ